MINTKKKRASGFPEPVMKIPKSVISKIGTLNLYPFRNKKNPKAPKTYAKR